MLLSSFRVGWIMYHKTPDEPQAVNGVIDLSDNVLIDDQTYTLNGEWTFYPNLFLTPGTDNSLSKSSIQVPNNWVENLGQQNEPPAYGYGTYRVRIKLPRNEEDYYGLQIMNVTSSAEVYINDKRVAGINEPTTSDTSKATKRGPFIGTFHTDADQVELMIHVSNYDMALTGGITDSVILGTATGIKQDVQNSLTLQFVVSVIYILHSFYAFMIYALGKGRFQKQLLFYGIMLVIAGFAILIDDAIVLQLPIDYISSHHLLFFLFNSTLLSMLLFIKHLFNIQSRFYPYIYSVLIVMTLVQITIPYEHYNYFLTLMVIYYFSAIPFLFIQTIRTIQKGFPGAIYVLLFITSYTSNTIWGATIKFTSFNIPYYPFDFIVSVAVIALLLFKNHIDVLKLNQTHTEKLEEADQKKDEFLANTSHELRNPLHGMLNTAQTILHDQAHTLTDATKQHLQLIVQIGERMTHTLNDLIDMTRLKDQQIKLNIRHMHIHAILPGVLGMLTAVSQKKGVHIHTHIPASFPKVQADEHRLIQILFNLLHNATKFTNEGTITIEGEVDEDSALAKIHVKDTGIGMRDDVLESIFQPYEQADGATSYGGIGLGLSICKQLVELHGGTLSATSTYGKGSTFTFTLPLAEGLEDDKVLSEVAAAVETNKDDKAFEIDPSVLPDHQKAKKGTKAKILLVDDDSINLKILSHMLEQDYEVTAVESGDQALSLIHVNDWDLVIADVMMPKMSGYELTEKIRETYTLSELPVILLTARYQKEDIYTGFIAGANDYVTKPTDTLELKARVEALTAMKHSVKEQLRTEAAWLQAQIQPHFLFNTLNTIAALSEIDTSRMVRLLDEFGNYLRKSFAMYNTEKLVSLDTEIELAQSYLYIEKERFGERLQVEWDVDSHTNVNIPPLTIQPLLENAVRHGVLKRQRGGLITIRIVNHYDYFTVEIEDNGVGMTQKVINQALNNDDTLKSSIGVANTHKRLKQQFGRGLTIKSKPGVGTTVQFVILRQ